MEESGGDVRAGRVGVGAGGGWPDDLLGTLDHPILDALVLSDASPLENCSNDLTNMVPILRIAVLIPELSDNPLNSNTRQLSNTLKREEVVNTST